MRLIRAQQPLKTNYAGDCRGRAPLQCLNSGSSQSAMKNQSCGHPEERPPNIATRNLGSGPPRQSTIGMLYKFWCNELWKFSVEQILHNFYRQFEEIFSRKSAVFWLYMSRTTLESSKNQLLMRDSKRLPGLKIYFLCLHYVEKLKRLHISFSPYRNLRPANYPQLIARSMLRGHAERCARGERQAIGRSISGMNGEDSHLEFARWGIEQILLTLRLPQI